MSVNDNVILVTNIYSNRQRVALSLEQPTGVWTNGFGWDPVGRLTNVTSEAGAFGSNYTPVNVNGSVNEIVMFSTPAEPIAGRGREGWVANPRPMPPENINGSVNEIVMLFTPAEPIAARGTEGWVANPRPLTDMYK